MRNPPAAADVAVAIGDRAPRAPGSSIDSVNFTNAGFDVTGDTSVSVS